MSGLAVVTMATANGACYEYAPRASAMAPSAGAHVAFVISDQGRVNLGDRLGSAVDRVEGTLVGADAGDAYVVSVDRVRSINGQSSHWSGERVTIAKSDVATVQQRQFSKTRTAVAVGGSVAAIGVLAALGTFGHIGIIGGSPNPEPPPSGSLRPR